VNINEIKKGKKTMVSFEVFPPKTETSIDELFITIGNLKKADPSFISVTYGAGGSGRERTVDIASKIKADFSIEPLAHLTCVGASEQGINAILDEMRSKDILNVLALRGDVPKGMDKTEAFSNFEFATDLIDLIVKRGDFYTMAAAYPEAHPQSKTNDDDLRHLKLKQDKGATRLNTQLCFNIDTVKRFIDDAKDFGISVPISVGVMPVLNPHQILRMVSLSGCSIPSDLAKMIALYGDDIDEFAKHGVDYATRQTQELLDFGVDGIHLYTMNKHEASLKILRAVGLG
jgi:methylenetetrahydrofolate reductase (NADPH)